MSHTIASAAKPAQTQQDTVCAQAAHVLLITAQQWGMCAEAMKAHKAAAVQRQAAAALPCLALRQWALNPWSMTA